MLEEAEADVSARAQEPSGRVVVTAFPSAAVAFAPVLVHRRTPTSPCCCARPRGRWACGRSVRAKPT